MIPERARTLIVEHIHSVEQLEILLLLRAEPDRDWTAEQINDRIKSSLSSVESRLGDLERSALVQREGNRYRYAPGPELAAAVTELANAYAERRYTVIDLIFSRPTDKLRVFARAFKLRGDGDG